MIAGREDQSGMKTKGDTEKAQIRKRKYSRDWNKWDAIFFVILAPFAILATLVILAPTGAINYLSGRFDLDLDFLVFVILMMYPLGVGTLIFPFVVIGVSFVVIGTLRLVFDGGRYTRKKKLIRSTQIGISILVITLLVLPLFIPIQLYSPGYKPFTHGFRERMRSKADIEAIRDWLKRRGKKEPTGDTVRFILYGWPKSVKVLEPRYVSLDMDKNGNPKVRLHWGGGFGHWGVEIGMEDMETPESDFSRYGEYRLPLQPGAYVWHELQ